MLKLFQEERQLFINEDIEVAKSTSEQGDNAYVSSQSPKGLYRITPANIPAQKLRSQPLAPRRATILPPDHFILSISLTSIHQQIHAWREFWSPQPWRVRLAPFGDGTTRSANKPLQHSTE